MATGTVNPNPASKTGSLWDGLNPHLLAQIFKLQKEGQGINAAWVQDTSAPIVEGALMEANLELALNWQSPFENSGTESQAPALAAMLQTGALQPIVTALTGSSNSTIAVAMDGASTSMASAARDKLNSFLSQFQGRTGITKLNSTQVFNGMQPVKIQGTLLLRAWRDPLSEVEAPMAQLMSWLLPQELSKDGSIIARAAGGQASFVETLMPSIAPVPVSMRYKGRIFKEMVIESLGVPLDSPIDANGHFVQLAMPIMLCSLSAIDAADWQSMGPI